MSKKISFTLILALVSGGAAAYLAFSFLRDTGTVEALTSDDPSIEVVLATRDLAPGDFITAQDVQLVAWPGNRVPEGYSVTPAEVVGRGVIASVHRNEPLLTTKLAAANAGGGLGITIPAGKRGMSVKVDDVIGVAGFATPGTRVDVLVTLDNAAQLTEARTQLVLQNIVVLAAGQTTERDFRGEPKEVPVVTLLVSPEEAEKLALGTAKGRIQLALRNPLDLEVAETEGVGAQSLLPSQAVRPVVRRRTGPAPEPKHSVDVFRGPDKTSREIGSGGGR
jgi:pilus assembly protein CpaB